MVKTPKKVFWGGFKGFWYLLRRCRRTLRGRFASKKKMGARNGFLMFFDFFFEDLDEV